MVVLTLFCIFVTAPTAPKKPGLLLFSIPLIVLDAIGERDLLVAFILGAAILASLLLVVVLLSGAPRAETERVADCPPEEIADEAMFCLVNAAFGLVKVQVNSF